MSTAERADFSTSAASSNNEDAVISDLSAHRKKQRVIHESFDMAAAAGEFEEAKHIAHTALTSEGTLRITADRARLALKAISLSEHARLWALQHEKNPRYKDISRQTTYQKSAGLLQEIHGARSRVTFRADRHEQAVERYRSLTGVLSEVTIFSLLVHNDEHSPFIVTPSTYAEDHGFIAKGGIHTGFDFHVIPSNSIDMETELQVKTGLHDPALYTPNITITHTEHVAGLYHEGYKELPLTIATDALYKTTRRSYRHITSANRRLHKKITDGLHHRED
jgi:hypothetical protein